MIVAVDTQCILPGKVGGIENYTLGLIEALQLPESPASQIVLLTRPENHWLFAGFGDGRTHVLWLERPRQSWEELRKFDKSVADAALAEFQRRKLGVLRHFKVDVVHFPGNTVNPLELDLPVVLNLHDLQHRHFPQNFTAAEIASRENWWVKSARRADAMIAGSQFIQKDLCAQLGVEASKIFVTPDPFQAAFFVRPAEDKLAETRKKFGLGEAFFIYPAANWPHKNHKRLFEAFAAAKIAGAELILTGGGHETLSLPAGVRSLGRVSTEELVALYCMARGMICPSEFESWSIPIMEAMACGCPVASANVTSLGEQVGDAGLLFAPADVAVMAEAMRRLAGDAELRKTLSLRGRKRVEACSPANFIKTISRAYEFALSVYPSKKAA
jgi:glycosyltransferase involved in cell wall biosynthesis